MTTKAADRYADIARRMKYLGLDRDEPQAADPVIVLELEWIEAKRIPGSISYVDAGDLRMPGW